MTRYRARAALYRNSRTARGEIAPTTPFAGFGSRLPGGAGRNTGDGAWIAGTVGVECGIDHAGDSPF
jgi:hypothetical protein